MSPGRPIWVAESRNQPVALPPMAAAGVMAVTRTGLLWGPTESMLGSSLDAAALRQRAIAHNLANAETPGYRRFDVIFEELLAARQRALSRRQVPLRRTHPSHLDGLPRAPVHPVVVRDTTSFVRNDGNNVDLERELALLAKNGLFYQAALRTLGSRLGALRTVVSEGRR